MALAKVYSSGTKKATTSSSKTTTAAVPSSKQAKAVQTAYSSQKKQTGSTSSTAAVPSGYQERATQEASSGKTTWKPNQYSTTDPVMGNASKQVWNTYNNSSLANRGSTTPTNTDGGTSNNSGGTSNYSKYTSAYSGGSYGGSGGGSGISSLSSTQSALDQTALEAAQKAAAQAKALQALREARQAAIDAANGAIDQQTQALIDKYNSSIDTINSDYQDLINANNVNRYRDQRMLTENAANRGDVNSGLSRSEQLALATNYNGNENNIRKNLASELATVRNNIQSAQASAAQQKADNQVNGLNDYNTALNNLINATYSGYSPTNSDYYSLAKGILDNTISVPSGTLEEILAQRQQAALQQQMAAMGINANGSPLTQNYVMPTNTGALSSNNIAAALQQQNANENTYLRLLRANGLA